MDNAAKQSSYSHTNTVCAVMVTYNGGQIITETAGAIVGQVGHLVIVDNHSDAATLEYVQQIKRRHPDEVTVLLNRENKGVAAALNQGVSFALPRGFEWILTLDQDSLAEDRMVAKMLEEYGKYEPKDKVGIVAPRSILVTEGGVSRAVDKAAASNFEEVELIHTSGNLVKASTFARMGLFREDFFIDQVDYEFCFRLRKAGLRIIVATGPVMNHRLGDLRSARFLNRQVFPSNHSAYRRYYMARNALVLSREVKDWRFIRRSCNFFLMDSIKIILYENSKRAKLWYMLKGVWDGLCRRLGALDGGREKAL